MTGAAVAADLRQALDVQCHLATQVAFHDVAPVSYTHLQQIAARCRARGIAVCGVIKGVNGLPEIVRTYKEAGIAELGTSRIEQIVRCREAGIEGPYLLIRIPGLSELPDVVRRCDCSLQSERAVLDALARECARQEKTHSVIVMADLGDLREGFWDREEMVETCVHVERELPHVHLLSLIHI